jgi:hypothetical protein
MRFLGSTRLRLLNCLVVYLNVLINDDVYLNPVTPGGHQAQETHRRTEEYRRELAHGSARVCVCVCVYSSRIACTRH